MDVLVEGVAPVVPLSAGVQGAAVVLVVAD
jgi:hypothetical protein